MKDGVSVIICCYNSSWVIERCLQMLLAQKTTESLKWEIIVVNNASTDETREIVQQVLKEAPIPFLVVDEITPGLLSARKKGLSYASYCYTIYCDDDNLLCDTYVQTAYNIISTRPYLGALGGRGIAEFQSEPDLIVMDFLDCYAVGEQHGHSSEMLWGAGVCLRTDVVKKIYTTQKMYLTGRKGNLLLAGDDTELILSIRLNGYMTDCDDKLLYTHVLASKRLTRDYFLSMLTGFTLAIPVVTIYKMILKRRSFYFIYLYYILVNLSYVKRFMFNYERWRNVDLKIKGDTVKAYHFWKFHYLHKIYTSLAQLYMKE